MNKTKILIVEDESIIADDLQAMLEDIGYTCPEPCSNYKDALEILTLEQLDLVMLDINLFGKPDGIKLAQYIRNYHTIPFIFLTANSDKATLDKAKATRPDGYLMKPFQKEALYSAIEVALHNFNHRKNNTPSQISPIRPFLFIKEKDYFHKVFFDEILYLSSEHVYVTVHTTTRKFLVRSSMQEYIDNFDGSLFVYVHRSYVVNVSKIDKINTTHIFVNDVEVPVSKQYREKLLQKLNIDC